MTTATPTTRSFVSGYGPDFRRGVATDHVGAAQAAGWRVHIAASRRTYISDPTGATFPVLCGELRVISTEDGPMTGRCGEYVRNNDFMCPAHIEERKGQLDFTAAGTVCENMWPTPMLDDPEAGPTIEEPQLSRREVVIQSALIHPDWTVADHVHFMEHDEFRPVSADEVRAWLRPSLDERIKLAERYGFIQDKIACVTASTSLEDAKERIGRSCQGMTMDYMTEFSRESAAAKLAVEYAETIYANPQETPE